MDKKEKIRQIVLDSLADTPCYLLDLKIVGKSVISKIVVTIDSDSGVTVDECGEINKKISNQLDRYDLLDSSYVLVVTSPGAEEPIKNPRQYLKNKGRKIRIVSEENQTIIGKIEEIRENSLLIKVEKTKKKREELTEIEFSKIKKSNIIISFN